MLVVVVLDFVWWVFDCGFLSPKMKRWVLIYYVLDFVCWELISSGFLSLEMVFSCGCFDDAGYFSCIRLIF
ncbi:hypothetical protein HanHA89_Chr13g0528211 [Helianthus annuus]|nr:hypothetical protein HanHA89_Chr13g0528211 [Helianthus annuus]